MSSLLKLSIACAITLAASASLAANITCKGQNDNGTDITFKHITRPDGSLKISIIESQDGDVIYKNSWSSDLTSRSLKVNGLTLQDSSGSRGEYYSQLELTGDTGSLNYEENDSSWEYSIHVSQLTCATK